MRYLISSLFVLLFATSAHANCEAKQTLCNATCELTHFSDKLAVKGCQSKCIAKRAVCETEEGAEKATDAGKKAWEGTKSFMKGLTE